MKILLVDDRDDVRTVCKIGFKAASRERGLKIEILEASTGTEAVELFKKHNPDFVIMDILLEEDMNGYEALKLMKESKEDMKAVVVSAYCYKDEAVNSVEENLAIEKFNKPIDYTNVLDFVCKNHDGSE